MIINLKKVTETKKNNLMMSSIKLFENKRIRSHWDEAEEQWYFSVVDVVEILTGSPDSKDYWYRMKKREKLSGFELSTICRQLKLVSSGGKRYATDCADDQQGELN